MELYVFCTRGKMLTLAVGLTMVLSCLQVESSSSWMQAFDATPKQRSYSRLKQLDADYHGSKVFDLKQLPRYVFGCHVIPFMGANDIHNLMITAKSLRSALWEELPFFFKEKQRKEQMECYLENPECLIPVATASLRQYIRTRYSFAINEGSIALPSTPAKKINQIDLLAIKGDLFIQCLDRFQEPITSVAGKMFYTLSFKSWSRFPPDLLTYRKARLLATIYNYLSLPNIIKALHIPDNSQARNNTQHAICDHFAVLAVLQDKRASNKQRQLAQRLLQDILAADGESWLSRFSLVNLALYHGTFFLSCEAACGCTGLSKRLIQCGVDINGRDRDGHTPLHYAAQHGNTRALNFLLANHARISQPNRWGRTPLSWASCYEYPDIVKALLGQGADVNSSDRFGRTSLHYASMFDRLEVAKLLLGKGSDIHKRDNDGESMLHLAVSANALNVAKLLIKYGASVSVRDNRGATPLHRIVDIAGRHSPKSMLRLLLANNADINAQDNSGCTPLMNAVSLKVGLEAAKLLITHGADVDVSHPIEGSLLQWVERDLARIQKLVWHTIVGAPPCDNEQVKYLHFLARVGGIKPSVQIPFYSSTSHEQHGKTFSFTHSMPCYTMSPPLISPQSAFLVLSQHSYAHIRQVFGHKILVNLKEAHFYKRVLDLIKKA